MRRHIYFSILLLLPACNLQTQDKDEPVHLPGSELYETISAIPAAPGFIRSATGINPFGDWLRNIKLKKDKRVFLYNGTLKRDQSVQFAVLDEPVGNKDLQQCADAIMRLRAEYFFSKNDFDSIHFAATDGTILSFSKWRSGIRYYLSGNRLNMTFTKNSTVNIHDDFENYLETVFRYAGTYSLASELTVAGIKNIQPGDIFIQPGFPGHAMIVADMCVNKEGKKLFMLAQGYMPAQDIHIVKNLLNEKYSPWYEVPDSGDIITPAWGFRNTQLKRWK